MDWPVGATERKPRGHHWALLTAVLVVAVIFGLLDLIGGSAPGSRFQAVDDVVLRLLGGGLILFSIGLPFRQNWAFIGLICVLALSILEFFVTFDFGASSLAETVFGLGITVDFLAVPLGLLFWLRRVFVRAREPQRHESL